MKTTRLFSLLIAFLMIFSSLPLIAIAEGENEFEQPYDYVSHFPDRDEPYVELYEEYVEGSTYQWYKDEVAIEGETEPELKCELEFAAEYTCFITLPNAKKIRPAFDTNPTILSQPNESYPLFEVTDIDRIESYQWYAHVITDTAITDENASNKCSTCENEKYSSYDKDENLWTGAFISKVEGIYEFFCFEVELKAGDMLLVDVGPEVQEIRITDSDYDIVDSPSYSLVGDIGVYTVEVDETYTVSIFSTSEDSKVSAYIRNAETDVLLEDETESKLENGMFGGYYYCVVTYDNGDTLKSNLVDIIPEVYEQPNAETYDFYVSNSHLAKFQWYQVILNEDGDEEIITLEGENYYILQNYERNGVYYCEAAYPLCMVLKSKRVTALPVILEQPSAMSPEFLVTFEDEAEFTWYETEIETTFIDDEMAEPAVTDGEVATYDEATGEWTGAPWFSYEDEDGYTEYGIDVMYVELEAGTQIRMAVSDISKLPYSEISLWGNDAGGYYTEFTDDGYAYFTVAEDDVYNIYFYAEDPTVTITVEILEYTHTLIEGENEKKLSVYEKDKYYTAMASYDDGVILISDPFEMVAKIIKQPTSEDPSVDVNVKEDDIKYQWYEAIPETSDVTIKDVELTDEDNPATYDSETKEWTPTIYDAYVNGDGSATYELDLFIIKLEAGDMIKFVPGEELEYEEIIAIQEKGEDLYISPNADGSYVFTAPVSQEYYFYTYDDNAEVTFKVTKTTYSLGDAIEGQDEAELIGVPSGTYFCVVTYNDGTELISNVANIFIAGDIDADGDVDATDYILVKRAVLKSITLTEEQAKFADIDADGDIDATDYVLVKRIVLGTYKA